ncbi:MAG: helix-turn-helix transcriptional regulator, partial [Anaeroplasmataceae bacterium]|nr:helix-turn-helix transcriptional regulator [Anaeroplasmataceae bacterium]
MDRIKMGNLLAELRKEKNLSQTDLAETMGVTFQAVSKWERGEAIPDITILEKLSSFYNVMIEDIINGEIALEAKESKYCKSKEVTKWEDGFLNQKRNFGFWFSLAYLLLYILLGFCPFGRIYEHKYYYEYIFSSGFDLSHFFLLIQLLTTFSIVVFTLLFYVCTSKKSFLALYKTRFIFIIINLATLIINSHI